jgi:lipopolysaccharide/colanic/teichoic acid biosynthesis glycosyltransferase
VASSAYPLPKQILDKTAALILLAALLPLLAVVLAVMACDQLLVRRDRGPFLYREDRISRGRVFGLIKFRTLRTNVLDEMRAAGRHARLYEADPANLTWAGRRLLKPWYLDEVPQLLNVLRGDMSLVGPRPWPPEMVARQVRDGLTYRNEVAAGLTGPAQVTKGSGGRFADLDLEYVSSCRQLGGWKLLRLDLALLADTVRVMARGEGLNY